MRLNVWRLPASLAILIITLPVTAQDAIVFKTGKRVEGKIVEERDDKIFIENPLTGVTGFDRANIERIERGGGTTAPGATTPAADGKPENLIRSTLDAVAANPAAANSLADNFSKAVYQLLQQAQGSRAAGNLEQAGTEYRTLLRALLNPASVALLRGEEFHGKIRQTVADELADVDYRLGIAAAQQTATMRQAQAYLTEAVQLAPENLSYRYELARVTQANGDWQSAAAGYEAVAQSASAPPDLKARAQTALAALRGSAAPVATAPTLGPPPVQATPAAVTAAPPAPPAGPATRTTIPAPTGQMAESEAPPPPPAGPWHNPQRLLHTLRHNPVSDRIIKLTDTVSLTEYLPLLGGVVGFIIVFWIIPAWIVKKLAYAGNTVAARYRMTARTLGLLVLFPILYTVLTRPRPKSRCPYCGKGIDNIDAYSDLNFYSCPHCGESITPIYNLADYIRHLMEQMESHARHRKTGTELDSALEKDAMLKLVRSILTLASRKRASDLHIDSELEGSKVRARIDGVMYDLLSIPKSLSNAVVSALKIMANLDITERRAPQDGKINLFIDKQDLDLRINTSPAAMGEKVTIRILNPRHIAVDPTRLGLETDNLEKFERAIRRPHGLFIVTGPSGSGKSTTLYVALNEINTGDKNIITIEDPIEYQLKGLNQMQVNPAANFTFATGLRSILRQDPDVIMVGEIRDHETADIAVEAAMTGHLVLTTLHTTDAPTAFGRLADLGIESKRFSQAIIAIVAQRLVRTICSECKKTYKPKKTDIDMLGLATQAREFAFVHGAGCENCMNTGFHGRIGIFEFLMPDETMREMLETNATVSVIRELARRTGYRTLREEGILKVMQGVTTVEEVIRITS